MGSWTITEKRGSNNKSQGETKARESKGWVWGTASRTSSIDNSQGVDRNQILGPIPSSVPIQDYSLHQVFGRHSIKPDISREWISQLFLADPQARSRHSIHSILSLHQLLIFIGLLELSKAYMTKFPPLSAESFNVSKVFLPPFVYPKPNHAPPNNIIVSAEQGEASTLQMSYS